MIIPVSRDRPAYRVNLNLGQAENQYVAGLKIGGVHFWWLKINWVGDNWHVNPDPTMVKIEFRAIRNKVYVMLAPLININGYFASMIPKISPALHLDQIIRFGVHP